MMRFQVKYLTPTGETFRNYVDSYERVKKISTSYAAKHKWRVAYIRGEWL